jgi:single-strand DNA-binding protein
MASVNKVILIGNCGRDPEVRYMASGQAVTNLTIATSTKRKDKVSGQMLEDTQWHRVTFYDKLAEIAGEYVKKGRPIYVEGRLKYGVYTDKTSGVEKNTVDIVATELQLLGGKDEGGKREEAPRQAAQKPVAQGGKGGFEDMDDDIPFADPLKSRAFCLSV